MVIQVVVFVLGLQLHIGCLVLVWLDIGMSLGGKCSGVAIPILFVLVVGY
jgi:hypothetical protein